MFNRVSSSGIQRLASVFKDEKFSDNLLLNSAPKGFEKYGDKQKKEEASEDKKSPFKGFNLGGQNSGGGGGGNKENRNEQLKSLYPYLGGALFALTLYYFQLRYKEITWRDFVNDYLGKGSVQRLEVVNKKWVRVVTKYPENVTFQKIKILFFNFFA